MCCAHFLLSFNLKIWSVVRIRVLDFPAEAGGAFVTVPWLQKFKLHLQVTIPVGDYVLSRDICVERKAVTDLVQSLQ